MRVDPYLRAHRGLVVLLAAALPVLTCLLLTLARDAISSRDGLWAGQEVDHRNLGVGVHHDRMIAPDATSGNRIVAQGRSRG